MSIVNKTLPDEVGGVLDRPTLIVEQLLVPDNLAKPQGKAPTESSKISNTSKATRNKASK